MLPPGFPGTTDHVASLVSGMHNLTLAAAAQSQQTVAGQTAGVPTQVQYVAASPYGPMYGAGPFYQVSQLS